MRQPRLRAVRGAVAVPVTVASSAASRVERTANAAEPEAPVFTPSGFRAGSSAVVGPSRKGLPLPAARRGMDTGERSPMTQTFPAWLRDQSTRDDEVGTIAQEFAARTDLPEHGGRSIYEGYFASEPAEAQSGFDRAWSEFEADVQPSPASDDPDGLR